MGGEDLARILARLREHSREVQAQYRARLLGVFGSFARGEEGPASDLDLLVEFLPGASLFDLVRLADYLEEVLGLRVDIVPVDTLRKEVREQVLRELVPV